MLLAVVTGKGGPFSGGLVESVHVYEKDIKSPITKQKIFEYCMDLFPIVQNIIYSPTLN
jgi:hypothetical protein